MNTEDQNGSMNGHENGTYITKVIPLPATALDLVYKTKKRLSLAKEHDVILKMRVAWRRFKHVARTDRLVLEFVPTAATAAPPAE
jgi:hypothetical protein